MKAFKPTTAVSILLTALLFLVIGWLIYPWLLNAVMAGSEGILVSPSFTALTVCRLWTALSLAWLGTVTSACILFLKYKTAAQTVWRIVTGLVLIAVASAVGWLFFIQYKIALAIRSLVEIQSLIGNAGALSIEDIPVYEAGVFASIIVLLTTVLFSFWMNTRKHESTAEAGRPGGC